MHKILCLQCPGIQELCNNGKCSFETSYKGTGENFGTFQLFEFSFFLLLIPNKLCVELLQMFLEVFHPEYVGNQGYDSQLRRSPFPTIQICYEVRKTSPAMSNEDITMDKEETH